MFIFAIVAYNRNNHKKRVAYIVSVYNDHKHHDVPDTYILRNVFPKFNIYLSYRQWMNYKNMPAREVQNTGQLRLF